MYKGRPVAALIMAGGSGTRFGSDAPKQFVPMDGETMLRRAIRAFENHPSVDEVIVVVPSGYEDFAEGRKTASAGADRAASVRNGLDAVPSRFEGGLVLIHDAARPFVARAVIDRVLEAACEAGAAVPAVPVTDTVYDDDSNDGEQTVRVLPRGRLAAAQTPQGFDLALIRAAHARAFAEGLTVTDDGSTALAAGCELRLVEGDAANRKITTREDWPVTPARRAGIGFDAHRFETGPAARRPLVLGGVAIPFDRGLEGHSDADVLTHALMDAILGALHLGDIGLLFPDTDERYRGISSMVLLADVTARMREAGYEIENADTTLVCERPKIAPHRETVERSLAEALGVQPEHVSVKATTTEKLGFTGREEGIAAEAIVLLQEINK